MTNETVAPQGSPGDIINWPMLKLVYRTDPDKIAALLPPGIEPGDDPFVRLTIYNFPVPDEPEYGIVTSVDANFNGTAGEFTLGYGIDQESAIVVLRIFLCGCRRFLGNETCVSPKLLARVAGVRAGFHKALVDRVDPELQVLAYSQKVALLPHPTL